MSLRNKYYQAVGQLETAKAYANDTEKEVVERAIYLLKEYPKLAVGVQISKTKRDQLVIIEEPKVITVGLRKPKDTIRVHIEVQDLDGTPKHHDTHKDLYSTWAVVHALNSSQLLNIIDLIEAKLGGN